MRKNRIAESFGLALAAAFVLTPAASAQHLGMGGMMGAGSARIMTPAAAFRAPSGTSVMRSGNLRTAPMNNTSLRTGSTPRKAASAAYLVNGTPDPYLNSGINPFYVNGVLNAGPGSTIVGNNNLLGVKAFIDPVTQLELATYERLQRNLQSSGIYLPLLPAYAAVPVDENQGADSYPPDQSQAAPPEAQAPPPQVIIVQEAAPTAAADSEAPQAPQAEQQPPLRDEGEFLLIFNDGHSENAAAFTRSGNQVVYVTPDGMRQTVPVSTIDLEATQRVNQERGTPLQLD